MNFYIYIFSIIAYVEASRDCFYEQNGYAGIIYAKNSSNDVKSKCTWIIETKTSLLVQLRFIDLQLDCKADYLKIYDGNVASGNLIGKYCGHTIPPNIESTGEQLTLILKTTKTNENKGFEASWLGIYKYDTVQAVRLKRQAQQSSDSCGGQLSGKSGVIKSPGFPSTYPPSSSCQWIITTDEFHVIVLTFKEFDLEKHKKCRYDYVTIKDGESREAPLIGEFCGMNTPKEVKSSGNSLVVEFRSDTTTSGKGFMATWTVKRKISIADCGGVFNTEVGKIQSPGYPKSSVKRVICKWNIEVPKGGRVKLQFSDLDITEHQGCGKGYLQLKNSDGSLLNTHCGYVIPRPVISTENKLTIVFLSDGLVKSRGFQATWSTQYPSEVTEKPNLEKESLCGSTFRSTSGYIYRSSSQQNCSWNIQVSDGNRISVTFLNLNLAADPDCYREQIEVRDGLSNAPLLTRSCGQLKPNMVTSSANQIQIRHTVFEAQPTSLIRVYWETFDESKRNKLFNKATCGIVTVVAQKMSNGIPQGLGTLPWVVGIMGMFGRVHCGGVILSEEWVLTAAHCFERLPWTSLWTVRAGEWNLMKIEGKEQTIQIKRIFMHPGYNANTQENDIALLHLVQPFILNEYVKPVCLPTDKTPLTTGTRCSIAGWGARKFLRQPKEPLTHIKPKIISSEKCAGKEMYGSKITSKMFCAGEKGTDSCQGDGGSGLTCFNGGKKHEVVGIASWGNGCAFPGKSGVYTDVRKYLDWIKEVTGSD